MKPISGSPASVPLHFTDSLKVFFGLTLHPRIYFLKISFYCFLLMLWGCGKFFMRLHLARCRILLDKLHLARITLSKYYRYYTFE